MNSLLEKLEKNRTAILLAEIGAWMHLLGKLSEEFIQAQSQGGGGFGYRQLCNKNPLGLEPGFYSLINDSWVENIFASLNSAIDSLPKKNRNPSNFCEFVNGHLIREPSPNCALLKILAAAHHISGAEEKDLPWNASDSKQEKKQPQMKTTYSATAFGFEDKPIREKTCLRDARDNLVTKICLILGEIKNNNYLTLNESWWQTNYLEIVQAFSNAYKTTVGDTRRPVNDITLWDATSLVSALFKSALAKLILAGWSEPINNATSPVLVKWRILRINLDTLGIMAKGVRIGDILGYKYVIEESLSECKKIIEIKYCLGNEIYRDETGIYFSFPDVDAKELSFWQNLKGELIKAVQGIELELLPCVEFSESVSNFKDLTSQRVFANKDKAFPYRNEGLSQDFFNLWSGVRPESEVCPICRLRPMKENSDGCKHCLERRKPRAELWIDSPKYTIWLDEVSDNNDKVALLAGSFGLKDWLNGELISTMAKKTPSSGRVRRCWQTTQDFINTTIFDEILYKFNWGQGLRRSRIQFKIGPIPDVTTGSTCDIDVEGTRMSPVCIDADNGTFVSTINLQILERWGNTVEEIASALGQRRKIKIKTEEDKPWTDAEIIDPKQANGKFQDYYPHVKIYDSPDQFMALVPAYEALEIAKKILEQYEIQFSKVRDRLPFHLGIIAFHRRTPLYVAMDATKRLIESFRAQTKSIHASVNSIDEITKVKELELQADSCYSSVPLTWRISYSTGDPDQPDEWHPYLRYNGGNPNRGNYSFDYDGNGHYVVHVGELRRNDCISIETAYFKMAYLENAAERFSIDEELRPIDDIKRLDETWRDIKNILSLKKLGLSQLYAYWGEVKKRYEDYEGDSVWEEFVKSALTNILKLSPEKDKESFDKLYQATKDRLLDLCMHWNLQVRKEKLKTGGQNE